MNRKKRRQQERTNRRRNKREVVQMPWETMERIWADKGIVQVQLKDGTIRTMTVKDAAERARAINRMPVPEWHRRKNQILVEKIIEICKEALAQQGDPRRDLVTQAITNYTKGLTAKGIPVSEVPETEDQKIGRFLIMFPTLDAQDIRSILRDERLRNDQKESLIREVHGQNLRRLEQIPDEALPRFVQGTSGPTL